MPLNICFGSLLVQATSNYTSHQRKKFIIIKKKKKKKTDSQPFRVWDQKIHRHLVHIAMRLHYVMFENILRWLQHDATSNNVNYRLSQKFKLLRNGEFKHLTIILTLPLMCGLKLPFNKWSPTHGIFNILNGR